MNKELEQEAEKYTKGNYPDYLDKKEFGLVVEDFIAGAKSKYVEKQKLEFAISLLLRLRASSISEIDDKVFELEKKLLEL